MGYCRPLLSDLSFHINGGQKAVITGFNGIGKSTLLKTLLGQIPVLGGSCRFSRQVSVGYFEQDLNWSCESQTPLQLVSGAYPEMSVKDVRKELSLCGISHKHAMQPVRTLSGGEQSKVKLCLLTLTPCSFLILDEPTNHLDALAKDALKEALSRFRGTVLLVSHEESFYKTWIQKILPVSSLAGPACEIPSEKA